MDNDIGNKSHDKNSTYLTYMIPVMRELLAKLSPEDEKEALECLSDDLREVLE